MFFNLPPYCTDMNVISVNNVNANFKNNVIEISTNT